MANVQERTSSRGVTTYRVGYRDDSGKYKYPPTLANPAGAERIKQIVEQQGYKIAGDVLGAQQQSEALAKDMVIESVPWQR